LSSNKVKNEDKFQGQTSKMKKPKTKNFKITPADVKLTGETFQDFYAKHLRQHPAELKWYKKQAIKDYNQTKDLNLFLANLDTIAKAQGKTKVVKTRNYKALSKDYPPMMDNILTLANNVGIDLMACWVK
jgi:DNA-binding phage protein